jgi:hypothetical protein
VVCEQGEWAALQPSDSGRPVLVRVGIASEALAHEASGYVAPGPKPSPYKLVPKLTKRTKGVSHDHDRGTGRA